MSISDQLLAIQAQIPGNVKLVAVSKTKPNEDIVAAYEAGQRVFGENRPQEMKQKHADLPKDIEWHYIGHLQTNKIKYIAPFVSLIHAVDSFKLLEAINNAAQKNERCIRCLLQFHIAQEETKFGLSLDEAVGIVESKAFAQLQNIEIVGVMGMGTFTDNLDAVRSEFKNLKSVFDRLKNGFFKDKESFKEISMGMSNDFLIAIEEGSTMVRVGSDIFGARNYNK
jgi:pyridoxal phosphate enzyme (YggS family)